MSEYGRTRGNIIAGIILICLGILFLANTSGLLSWSTWNLIIRFWPLLLVIAGLNILLKRSSFWWIVPLVIIILFVGMFYAGNYRGDGEGRFLNNKIYSGEYSQTRDLKGDIKSLNIDIGFAAGELRVSESGRDRLLYRSNLNYYGEQPDINYSVKKETGTGRLVIKQNKIRKITKLAETDNWKLELSREIPLDIKLNAGAGKMLLDLRKLMVEELEVNTGVSDLTVYFNNYSTGAVISSGASSIKLHIPETAGVKIEASSVLNNNNFKEAGLVKVSDNLYRSPNYPEAEQKIELLVSIPASNIKLFYR